MKKLMRRAGSILLLAALSLLVFSSVAFAAGETVKVQIPVEMKSSGYVPSTAEDLNVVLTAKDAAPMPAGATEGVYKLVVNGDGTKQFPEIEFTRVGIYKYSIGLEKGTHNRGTYDETVYDVEVYITNDEVNGGLDSVVLGYVTANGKKQTIGFENSYRRPSSGGGSDPDPDPTPRERPVEVIDDTDTPLADGLFDIIEDLEVPLAGVLPATGDEAQILLYVVLIMIGIGGLTAEYRIRKRNMN